MSLYFEDEHLAVHCGDARAVLATLPDESVHCVVTSPPYWGLRDYGTAGQLGLERTPEEYVANMVAVFREVRRVLRDDGTLWLNLGDSYAGSWGNQGRKAERGTQRPINGPMLQNLGMVTHAVDCDMGEDCNCGAGLGGVYPDRTHTGSWVNDHPTLKPKDLVGIPWMVAFALRADGWYLRSDIIWSKPNPMPESVNDRPTKAHEYLFLLSKSPRYYYDAEAVREPLSSSSLDRLTQPGLADQVGSDRVPGKTNGNMKAVVRWPGIGPQHGATRNRREKYEDMRVNAGRNIRSVWTIATQPYPGAHFATFPPKLVEPCVKAGTSAKGVCPECGAPWGRVVERRGELDESRPQARRALELARAHGLTDAHLAAVRAVGVTDAGKARITQDGTGQNNPAVQTLADEAKAALGGYYREFLLDRGSTTGWQPSCKHDAQPVAATVLDPFAGSGTTGLVANRLGRRAVLIDLSMDYIGQALARNAQAPLGLGA